MPVLTGSRLHNPGFLGFRHQALARNFNFEHKRFHIASQHNVAAAAQDTVTFMPIFQVFLRLNGVCLRPNSHQRIGLGHYAKAVVRLKGYVLGHVHGRIVAFSDLIVEPHAIF